MAGERDLHGADWHSAALGTLTNLTGAYNDVTDVYGSYSSNSRPNNNGQSAKLNGSAVSRLNQWFNTCVFSQPAPFTYGTAGRTLPDVRWHGIQQSRLWHIQEQPIRPRISRFNLQFRASSSMWRIIAGSDCPACPRQLDFRCCEQPGGISPRLIQMALNSRSDSVAGPGFRSFGLLDSWSTAPQGGSVTSGGGRPNASSCYHSNGNRRSRPTGLFINDNLRYPAKIVRVSANIGKRAVIQIPRSVLHSKLTIEPVWTLTVGDSCY